MRTVAWIGAIIGLTSCGDGGDDGECSSWLATYDLTGSTFFIDATLDFTITCDEPYDADDTMGPGVVVVRFSNDGGAPAPGTAMVVSYSMDQDFVTGAAGIASVHTELENATPTEECGNAVGTYDGTAITWTGGTLANYCQTGQVSCTGGQCGNFGSPPEGEPIVYDGCTSMALSDFTFNEDLSTLAMAATVVNQDDNQTTSLTLVGSLVTLVEDATSPRCACD